MDDASSAVAFVPSVIQAQSVRLFPDQWGSHIAVRWELNGCVMGMSLRLNPCCGVQQMLELRSPLFATQSY